MSLTPVTGGGWDISGATDFIWGCPEHKRRQGDEDRPSNVDNTDTEAVRNIMRVYEPSNTRYLKEALSVHCPLPRLQGLEGGGTNDLLCESYEAYNTSKP